MGSGAVKRLISLILFVSSTAFALDFGGGGSGSTSISTATAITGGTDKGVFYQSGGLLTNGSVPSYDSATNTLSFGNTGIVDAGTSGTMKSSIFQQSNSSGGLVLGVSTGTLLAPGPSGDVRINTAGTTSSGNSGNIFLATGGSAASTGTVSIILGGTNAITFSPLGKGNDLIQSTATFDPTINGEQRIILFDGTTTSTSTTQLSSTFWAFMHDNSSGTVTSAHAGAVFGRAIQGTLNQDFTFGVEGNCWGKSQASGGVGTTGACVGVIGHAVWDGVSTATPTVPTIGFNGRAEFTDPTVTTTRNGSRMADYIAFRGETYNSSTSTWDSRNYLLYGAVGGSDVAKIVTNGPVMSIPPSAQTIVANGIILGDACGGVKQITSAGAVATDPTNTFSVPSVSTVGTANTGCFMSVVNSGSNLITLKANATFLTFAGEDINLNAAGGSVWVFSNGANWVQASPVTQPALTGVYLSSVTAGVSLAGTGTFGNVATITLTPGDWRVFATCDELANGATVTASTMAVSINSGNTTTDHVTGANQMSMSLPTAVDDGEGIIANYRIAVASNTQIWAKIKGVFSIATPLAYCSLTADRRN